MDAASLRSFAEILSSLVAFDSFNLPAHCEQNWYQQHG